MTEDELFEDVKYWKGRADAAETERNEARAALAMRNSDIQELLRAAALMANVCYNAKQNDKVPEGIRTWLANTQEGFDKARDAYLSVVGEGKEPS